MPFEKGHKLNVGSNRGGRKGYEWESKQQEKMISLLNKFLILTEKIHNGKATKKQAEAFDRLKPVILKILDKLHASKTENKIEIETPILISHRKYD